METNLLSPKKQAEKLIRKYNDNLPAMNDLINDFRNWLSSFNTFQETNQSKFMLKYWDEVSINIQELRKTQLK